MLYFDRAVFERLLLDYSTLSRALLVLEAARFQRALEWAQQNATLPLEALLAKRVSMFAHRDPSFAVEGRASEFKVTQLTCSISPCKSVVATHLSRVPTGYGTTGHIKLTDGTE